MTVIQIACHVQLYDDLAACLHLGIVVVNGKGGSRVGYTVGRRGWMYVGGRRYERTSTAHRLHLTKTCVEEYVYAAPAPAPAYLDTFKGLTSLVLFFRVLQPAIDFAPWLPCHVLRLRTVKNKHPRLKAEQIGARQIGRPAFSTVHTVR